MDLNQSTDLIKLGNTMAFPVHGPADNTNNGVLLTNPNNFNANAEVALNNLCPPLNLQMGTAGGPYNTGITAGVPVYQATANNVAATTPNLTRFPSTFPVHATTEANVIPVHEYGSIAGAETTVPRLNTVPSIGNGQDLNSNQAKKKHKKPEKKTAAKGKSTYNKKRRQCRFPGCEKTIKSQGHCQRHGAIAKRCKVDGCEKQAQGTHGGMCKRHWKEKNVPKPPPREEDLPIEPKGESVYDKIIPASIAWKVTKKRIEEKELMPFVKHLRDGKDLPSAWHRNQERASRGIRPVSSTSLQLEVWERQLVLLEIMLITGTMWSSNKDLAHAWGREKGFHNIIMNQVCNRRGELERKRRSDTGKVYSQDQKRNFKEKLHKAKQEKKARKESHIAPTSVNTVPLTEGNIEMSTADIQMVGTTTIADPIDPNQNIKPEVAAAAMVDEDMQGFEADSAIAVEAAAIQIIDSATGTELATSTQADSVEIVTNINETPTDLVSSAHGSATNHVSNLSETEKDVATSTDTTAVVIDNNVNGISTDLDSGDVVTNLDEAGTELGTSTLTATENIVPKTETPLDLASSVSVKATDLGANLNITGTDPTTSTNTAVDIGTRSNVTPTDLASSTQTTIEDGKPKLNGDVTELATSTLTTTVDMNSNVNGTETTVVPSNSPVVHDTDHNSNVNDSVFDKQQENDLATNEINPVDAPKEESEKKIGDGMTNKNTGTDFTIGVDAVNKTETTLHVSTLEPNAVETEHMNIDTPFNMQVDQEIFDPVDGTSKSSFN
mmetsp:Transcript_5976/g.8694  ORF Transcript_5976/g.8694 Transcript_5976/m.8694 type:complete len:780 (+) Transcript_5976:48-2387(+)